MWRIAVKCSRLITLRKTFSGRSLLVESQPVPFFNSRQRSPPAGDLKYAAGLPMNAAHTPGSCVRRHGKNPVLLIERDYIDTEAHSACMDAG